MKKSILTFIIIISLTSCIDTNWSIELWRQKIENSNLSVYKYDAWGGRDTQLAGFKVLDSIAGFTQKDIYDNQGFSYLESIPNKDTITVISLSSRTDNNKDVILTSLKETDYKNYILKFKSIEYNKYSSIKTVFENYRFKSFKETRDSLIFFNNKSKFVNGKNHERISIPKGNIYLMTSPDNQTVVRITYDDVKIPTKETGHELQEKESTPNKLIQSTIYFDPIEEISITEFSNYGIYKPVKSINNNGQHTM